jgi:ribosomal protein S18 acetylase RimI-like enzyme
MLTLRPGTPADAPALVAIHRAALDAALPGLARPWTEAETLAWFAGELLACNHPAWTHSGRDSPAQQKQGLHRPGDRQADAGRARHRTTIAEQAGQPVGYLALAGDEVLHLYVTPTLHRRGIGTTLLEMAKAAAPSGLTLACFRRNRAALAFYGRCGFRVTACRDATANTEGEPDMILAWTPPPLITRKGESA